MQPYGHLGVLGRESALLIGAMRALRFLNGHHRGRKICQQGIAPFLGDGRKRLSLSDERNAD
jgi:hypothetical protein